MLKRFILWDYRRGSWQYDVMVGLILAFLFLTPRDWFRDQPRNPNARSIAILPSESGSSAFWIDKELLAGKPEGQQTAVVTEPLRTLTHNRHLTVTRVEAVRGSEHELLGYMAFARP